MDDNAGATDGSFQQIVDSGDQSVFDLITKTPGPAGRLPLTAELRIKKGQNVRTSATVMASMANSAAGSSHVA